MSFLGTSGKDGLALPKRAGSAIAPRTSQEPARNPCPERVSPVEQRRRRPEPRPAVRSARRRGCSSARRRRMLRRLQMACAAGTPSSEEPTKKPRRVFATLGLGWFSSPMARDCVAFKMPKDWTSSIGFWQTLFFSCLICYIGASEVPELTCETDIVAEVVCHWEVNDTTNCSKEFRLHYSRRFTKRKLECDLQNRRILEPASSACFCVIPETVLETTYTFLLESKRDNASRTYTIDFGDIDVKPRALRNLAVTKTERRSFILTWRKGYDMPHAVDYSRVTYQVRISSEGQKQVILKYLTEEVGHYEIFADNLLPGNNYSASVRYKLDSWGSDWSEWSVPCKWYNDFKSEGRWWVILLACFLMMVLVYTCYLCFTRLKQELWDEIPSPNKSNLGKSLLRRNTLPGDEGKAPLCVPSPSLLERQRSIKDSQPKDGATFPDWPNKVATTFPGSKLRNKWEPFFTPEVPSVEPSLTICGRLADAGSGTQMEEEGDHAPHMDALVDLVLDILGDGGHAEDAGTPAMPVLEGHPSTRASEEVLGDLSVFGRTPTNCPMGSSESGCQNSGIATSPCEASPAPEKHQNDSQSFSVSQYKLLLFPQKLSSAPYHATVTDGSGPPGECPDDGRATLQPSSYKSFSSPSTASFHQPGEHRLDLSSVGLSQPYSSWPTSCEVAAAPFFLPQLEVPSQNAPGIPCTIDSCMPGYRPFRTALPPSVASQDPSCLTLGSPYKPFLSVLRSMPQEAPLGPILRTEEVERETWQRVSLEEPLAFAFRLGREVEEEDSGQKGVKQEREGFVPQLPVATL